MTELLDWKTIWNETCRQQDFLADAGGRVRAVTALCGIRDGYIKIVSDIEISIVEAYATASFKLPLSPEEMETLAEYLFQAAEWQRDLIKRLAAHNAALEVAAEGAERQAEVA